jgi:Domain of unknown function (DUF4395)
METISTASAHSASSPHVDTHLAKFSQACTVLLTGLGFLLNQPIIVLIAAILLVLAALVPAVSPFRLLYRGIFLPLHVLRPRMVEDDPLPHRFAQGVGATFLIASTLVLLLTKNALVGWTLDLIIFVLVGTNLTVGFCAGCFVYYHLGRLGLMPRVRYEGGFHWRGV